MPPDRRRRRFRRPGANRWLTESLPAIRLELAPQVRSTLTAWMRLYGEANNLPGLATGPIETRFQRLREHASADTLVVWTTPTLWAQGEGIALRIPALRLEFFCELDGGHLTASRVAPVADDARPPDREVGSTGVVMQVEHVLLPPEQSVNGELDQGVALLETHFARLAGRRFGGFVEPLRQALDAEQADDDARTQRLTVPFKSAGIVRSGDEDIWKLAGVPAEALRQFDDGEWLEVLDGQGRSYTAARVTYTRASEGVLEIGVRSSSDPPKSGFVRPRSRRKILDQKRALLDELSSPTGSLPELVRFVAAPSSMPTPKPERPQRFVNPSVMRNKSQARAVALALGLEDGQALMIQGPPGTGKSTTAAEIDVQLILRDPGVRILVCSHSNHGTDNMLMKVLPYLEDAEERIARVGFYDRIAREARPFYAPSDADLGDKNIIFTTIDALALQDIAGGNLYDYVILDEANRAGVLDSLLALARGQRLILVGDAMQLQPVMSEAEQQIVSGHRRNGGRGDNRGTFAPLAGANHVIGKSLFAWLQERHFSQGATVLLDQQNRMHPAIGDLVSRVFYGGKVRTGPAAPRRGTGLPMFPQPVTWVDTRSLHGNRESRAGGTSLFNVAEARLVTNITRYLATHAPANVTIGVIAAYAEQKEVLRRMMNPRDLPAERQLEIDTVDAFEGREKDIIVLSLVRTNRRRDVGFLRLEQRLNVAVSRARRLIMIVGDTATLRQGYFHHLIATTNQVGQTIPAPKVLAQLSGKPRKQRRERLRDREQVAPQPVDGMVFEEGQQPEGTGSVDGAVPSVERPDAAGTPQEARRRRRKRAWERRRERLRQVQEGGVETPPDGEHGAEIDPYAYGGVFSPDDEAPTTFVPDDDQEAAPRRDAPSTPQNAPGVSRSARRRMLRRERRLAEAALATPSMEPTSEGVADVGAGTPATQQPTPIEQRQRRPRRVVPFVTEAAPQELEALQPATEPRPEPRRRTRRAATPDETTTGVEAVPSANVAAADIADVAATPVAPRARSRKGTPAQATAVEAPVEVQTPAGPMPKRRTPRKAAANAEPTTVATGSIADADLVPADMPAAPKRRTRPARAATAEPEPVTPPAPVPEPATAPVRASRRRTTSTPAVAPAPAQEVVAPAEKPERARTAPATAAEPAKPRARRASKKAEPAASEPVAEPAPKARARRRPADGA